MLENETIELNDEELEKVSGGENCNNPRGLKHGDTVLFYNEEPDAWMWGTFESYNSVTCTYLISWNDTTIIYPGGSTYTVKAKSGSFKEEYIGD